MYCYDKPEPLPRWGTSFVEVRRETDLSSVLILVTDGIWGMCVLFIKLEASLHGLPIRWVNTPQLSGELHVEEKGLNKSL